MAEKNKPEISQDSLKRFEFGMNWSEFIWNNMSPERVEAAKNRLLSTLRLPDLKGKTFLDIGCGSGLHSLAAIKAGVERVVGFDCDVDCVAITEQVKLKHGDRAKWTVLQGSVLDEKFMRSLEPADIVYAWGVLHHTGNMWQALRNARIALKPDGVMFLGLYSYTAYQNSTLMGMPTPEQWLKIKQFYNNSSSTVKWMMETLYVFMVFIRPPVMRPWLIFKRYREFVSLKKGYINNRGMELWTDVRDWLGGWPMEFVKEKELISFACEELEFDVAEMITGEGNTEFLFKAKGGNSWWNKIMNNKKIERLKGPFLHAGGYSWEIKLPHLKDMADTEFATSRSSLKLYENDQLMTYPHCGLVFIQTFGEGRYSHLGESLFFASTDNSDPNTNGRAYSIYYDI